jgi:RNA-directed DNA polymerase
MKVDWDATQPRGLTSSARSQGQLRGSREILQRIGERARQKSKEKWTNLLSHIRVPLLAEAYQRLRRDAAVGVDGVTWDEYGERLDERLRDLENRVHRDSYHPQPVRRVHIPKGDGKTRPPGIPALEESGGFSRCPCFVLKPCKKLPGRRGNPRGALARVLVFFSP